MYNFVDPQTGAHTNNIGREWTDLRSKVQKIGRKVDYEGHFHRIMFIRTFMNLNSAVHAFWIHVGIMKK